MAGITPPPADQSAAATDMLQKLSLDSQPNTTPQIPDSTTTTTTRKQPPSVDTGNMPIGIQSDRSITPQLPDSVDPTMCYYPSSAYYYGYDPTTTTTASTDYDGYTRYDGVEMTPGAYGENSYSYAPHGYSYAPYSPATSPVPTLVHDGQLYGAQQYQYPTPYFQSLAPTTGSYPTPAVPSKGGMAAGQAPLSIDSTSSKSNGFANSGGPKGANTGGLGAPAYQNSSYNANGYYGRPGGIPTSGYQDPRFGYDGLQSPSPWLENPYFSHGAAKPVTNSSMTSTFTNGNSVPSSRNQSFRPQFTGLHHPRPMSSMNTNSGFMNRIYPNKLYGQYGNAYRSGLGYGTNSYDTRTNGRGWMSVDNKYKPRGRGNGPYGYVNESVDGLNELNRGPRAKTTKPEKGFTPVALAVKGQNIPFAVSTDIEKEKSSGTPDLEQYNRPDFPESYPDAKFFIIKSYSEDDVHKSIKYNVWASTPNGNKKLDAAYQDAQQKSGSCPIFLLFSVNTSGQFVGVAEMAGPVDFNKTVEYWQQDKWTGCFPVKWHIVKDVPNTLLKHIILENNENKPVTNSRDTQEVKLEQGLQILKIFKDHSSKQCILDDFDFYEDRQKKIQEKKAKQLQFQKQNQIWEGKPTEEKKETVNGDLKSSEVASEFKDASSLVESNVDSKTMAKASGVPEKQLVADGVANGH